MTRSNTFDAERHRRAHQLRAEGLSQRAIGVELGLHRNQVVRYLARPLPKGGGHSNVRNLQEVWLDPFLQIPDIWRIPPGHGVSTAVPTPGPPGAPDRAIDLFDTDDEPVCTCIWVLQIRHKETGEFSAWTRDPEDEDERNRATMRWGCWKHNPVLTEQETTLINDVAPEATFVARMHSYRHFDSARRVAHRKNEKGEDGSYILMSRETNGLRWYDLLSAENLTPTKKTYERAKTLEVETRVALPHLDARLRDLERLRQVNTRHAWQLPQEGTVFDSEEDDEPRYDVMTTSESRSIQAVSKELLGYQINPGDRIDRDTWVRLYDYIKRYKR